MRSWDELARARTPSGDDIILRTRNHIYEIRYNDVQLMCSSCHRSEDFLAEKALRLLGRPVRTVLIGGLGLGYTLRMALNYLEDDAKVIVSEIVPEIVDWNSHHLGHLADYPLDDPRVEVRVEDVSRTLLQEPEIFDVILLDTDNGPEHLARAENGDLYQDDGINVVRRALTPTGIAAFWSSTISPPFEKRLESLPWFWRREAIPLPGGRIDAFHYVYLASNDAANLRYPRVIEASPAAISGSRSARLVDA